MSCSVCDGNVSGLVFCERHETAYKNIKEAFNNWRRAMDIEWMDYLKRIVENEFTGRWVREVAEFLIKKGINIS